MPAEIAYPEPLSLGASGRRAWRSELEQSLRPYLPQPYGARASFRPRVVIAHGNRGGRAGELIGDAGDDRMTATVGPHVAVDERVGAFTLAGPSVAPWARIVVNQDVPVSWLLRSAVKPALQLSMPTGGYVAAHASAVEIDGRGLVVMGWAETGKTEVALAAAEAGGRFISDKWSVLTPATVLPFPMDVAVRRWALAFFPRLRRELAASTMMRLRLTAAANRVVSSLDRASRGHMVANAGISIPARLLKLMDRVNISVADLNKAYGASSFAPEPVTTALVVALKRSPSSKIVMREGRAKELARRMVTSAAFERRRFREILDRYSYLNGKPDAYQGIAEAELSRLSAALDSCALIEVTAPFPCDPRRILDAVWPLR